MEEERPMAEPVRNDEPLSEMRFPESPGTRSTGPGPVPVANSAEPAGLLPDTLPDRPLGAWPPAVVGTEDTDLRGPETRANQVNIENAGERVGSALGAVVNQTKEIGGMMQDRMSEVKRKFRVIAGRRSTELKDRTAELTDEAQQRASELADQARREVRLWEFRARLYAQRSPLQFIAAAAAAGFAIGFLLRMWRDE
jgi:ElaB/YqjD/DUF883 family membrane-anchored ribosome-binding protein